MPYIPERLFEDKPDIFTPFVPRDRNNKVGECAHRENSEKVPNYRTNYLMYSLFGLVVVCLVKRSLIKLK